MSSGGEVVIKITGDDSEYEKKLNGLGTKAKLHKISVRKLCFRTDWWSVCLKTQSECRLHL